MIVYFSGSNRQIEKDAAVYRTIVHAIYESGGILAGNWVETAIRRKVLPSALEWWKDICNNAVEGIKDADAVIVEASGGSCLGVGYELATALQYQKPTLTLVRKDKQGDSYVNGIQHPSLTTRIYTVDHLADEVINFLRSSKS